MRLIFLGTGTSVGVPMIGCECNVCLSEDPRNTRYRASLWIEINGKHIVIDTPPEFRLQAIRHGLPRLDALLYTHAHADHVFGIDDIRRFNQMQRAIIPLYASKQTLDALQTMAGYIFDRSLQSWAIPKADPCLLNGPFELFGARVEPLHVWHGPMSVTAFRIENMAYVTDCSKIPTETMEKLQGLDLLILDALRPEPHPSHLSIPEAIQIVEQLAPRQTLFTHISHEVDHEATEATLPDHIRLAYDGMTIEL